MARAKRTQTAKRARTAPTISKRARSARRVTTPTSATTTKARIVPIDDFLLDPKNACHHTDRNRQAIKNSLKRVGAARSIVVNARGKVLAGNGVISEAKALGYKHVLLVPSDGRTLVAVERAGLSPELETELALNDNHTARLAEWDAGVLQALQKDGFDLHRVFHAQELSTIIGVEVPAIQKTDPSRSRGGAAPTEITAARAMHLLRGVKRTLPLVLWDGDASRFLPVKTLAVERLHQIGEGASVTYERCDVDCAPCKEKKPVVEVVTVT